MTRLGEVEMDEEEDAEEAIGAGSNLQRYGCGCTEITNENSKEN